MNTIVVGYWDKKKEKLRQKYHNLTEADLCFNIGRENVMMEMLGYKLGKTKEELRDIITGL